MRHIVCRSTIYEGIWEIPAMLACESNVLEEGYYVSKIASFSFLYPVRCARRSVSARV
jgi:hypothetical protein